MPDSPRGGREEQHMSQLQSGALYSHSGTGCQASPLAIRYEESTIAGASAAGTTSEVILQLNMFSMKYTLVACEPATEHNRQCQPKDSSTTNLTGGA
jgi:hypothetical protein